MLCVVDSNFLQREELRAFLGQSPDNRAVLTDYAAMEAYKGDTLASIFKSMAVLSEFPKQVFVLKTTGVVCGIPATELKDNRVLVDWPQSEGFERYCRDLKRAQQGSAPIQRQLLDMGREAQAQMDRMAADAGTMIAAFQANEALYSATDLEAIRSGAPLPSSALKQFIENVIGVSISMMRNHPEVKALPSPEDAPYAFIVRIALMAHLLHLRWIKTGAPREVGANKLRNDLVDINFAAFSTYFDDLLTADQKLNDIYQRGRYILSVITQGEGPQQSAEAEA